MPTGNTCRGRREKIYFSPDLFKRIKSCLGLAGSWDESLDPAIARVPYQAGGLGPFLFFLAHLVSHMTRKTKSLPSLPPTETRRACDGTGRLAAVCWQPEGQVWMWQQQMLFMAVYTKVPRGVAHVSPGAPRGPREVVLMGTGKSGGGPVLGYQFVGPWRNFCGICRETGGSQGSVLSPCGRRVCFSCQN